MGNPVRRLLDRQHEEGEFRVVWDGKDDFGDRIGKGVYVYKITVKSTLTNQRTEKFEKLVIL